MASSTTARLVARYDAAGTVQDEYVWDGQQMMAWLSSSGARKWTAYWGAGIDNLVSVGAEEHLLVTSRPCRSKAEGALSYGCARYTSTPATTVTCTCAVSSPSGGSEIGSSGSTTKSAS